MELVAGLPQRKGNKRCAAFAYNVKELRQQEMQVAQQAEKNYEHLVAAWQPRPPKQDGFAAASDRQGLNELPGDDSSRHATLRHEVDHTTKE